MATLQEERRRAQFDLQAMKVLLAGGEEALRVNDRIANLVVNDPVLDKSDRVSLDRKALFQNTLQKAKHVWELILENRLSEEEALKLRSLVDQPSYTDLHWGMFIPSIKGQGTEEQQQKWLPLAYKMAILGAYAQTEMGHGSNVQGLETTATLDIETDEFVLHTPTLTATKWWPGALGKVATHAIVYAQLIIRAKEYGVHAFVVQIRSLDDHKPLPGIAVGDIGVKFGNGGYNSMDNGFLSFDHFRIPRDHLLMRLATVTKDGKYVKSGAPRQLGYGAMVFVRQSIVAEASIYLSRAITIAVRYSAVRRQFGGSGDCPEVQVIDYKTQQHKLFSLLATTYAYRFLGQWMKWLYADVMARLEVNDYSTLPEVHACTAGLKSVTTAVTADGIEECRKLCGGHGYLCASGLPELYAAYVPACTYEGDNTILLLQVARFVMKTLSQLGSGIQPVGTASYFGELHQLATVNCNIKNGQDWLIAGNLQKAFEARSARLAASCAERIAKAHNPEAAFDKYAVDLVEAARAHCQVIIVSKFLQKSEEHIGGRGVKDQLIVLSRVYALSLISTHLGEFLSTGFLTSEQAVLARDELRELYPKVRTNAVALVDAFNHTDHYLGSALGRYDGDVYTHLYKSALRDPSNETVVVEGYEEYVRPILKQEVKGLHSRL